MIVIRHSITNDLPQLVNLIRKHIILQQGFDDSREIAPNIDWLQHISSRLHKPNRTILVAEVDGNIVGYADLQIVREDKIAPLGKLKRIIKLFLKSARNHPSSIFKPRQCGYILDFYVAESYRKSAVGVGLKLFRKCIEWFDHMGVNQIEGWMATSNVTAREFFHKLGCTEARVLVRKRI